MNRISMSFGLASALLLSACAHPIVITPDVSKLERKDIQPIDLNVGYFISDGDRQKSVESPGGGGDKVRYFPYKELEPALFKALSNVFRRAYPLKSASDAEGIKANDITFVFIPEISTNSSSTGVFTWPPTDFTVDLNCKAMDREGKVIWEKRFIGQGQAPYEEFKADFSLSAKRASQNAFEAFQRELSEAPALRR